MHSRCPILPAALIGFFDQALSSGFLVPTSGPYGRRYVPLPATSSRSRLAILVILVTLAHLPAVFAEPRLFSAPFNSYDAGSDLTCLAAGDLNGDGRTDLVAGSTPWPPDIALTILLATPDSSFERRSRIPGNSAHHVAIADFDGDRRMDLLFTHYPVGDYMVTVVLGNGDGTFGQPLPAYGITYPALAVGDFDHDGRPDLAGPQAVVLGRGDGTFGQPLAYPAGTNPWGVATADLNGDHWLDLVLADVGESTTTPGVSTVLLGRGDGTFSVGGRYDVGKFPNGIALGDVDGDGRLDAVVSNFYSAMVSVLPGRGDGTFGPQRVLASGDLPQGLLLADVVGNAELDVVVGHFCRPGISVLRGLGAGDFAPPIQFATGSNATAFAASDLDADGRLDLAAVHSGCQPGFPATFDGGGVSVLLRNPDGSLSAPTYVSGRGPSAVVLEDFDGDHKLDLGVANENSRSIALLKGVGDGTFGPATSRSVPGLAASIAVGDVNEDRLPDVIFGTWLPPSMGVLLGQGGTTLAPPYQVAADVNPRSIVTADLDSDGALDLVMTDLTSSSVAVFYGDAMGGFPTRASLPVGSSPQGVAVGDLNHDGKLDLVAASSGSGFVSIILGHEGRSFGERSDVPTGVDPVAVAIGDADHDGHHDLAVANRGSGTVRILRGRGDGTFERHVDLMAGRAPSNVLLQDLNLDCRDDVAVADAGRYEIDVFLGAGDGSFSAPQKFGTGKSPRFLAAGDVNHDNRVDLVVANGGSDDVAILLNRGRNPHQPDLDVDPRSCANVLVPRSPRPLEVMLLGDDEFDVLSVDVGSLVLEERVVPLRSEFADVGTPVPGGHVSACGRTIPDGVTDLRLDFDASEVARALAPISPGQEGQVVLRGRLRDGCLFESRDRIVVAAAPDTGPRILDPVGTRIRIQYVLGARVPVRLVVYDVAGRYVQEIERDVRGPGRHEVTWNAKAVPSGIYFVRLWVGESSAAAKVVVVH